MATVPADVMFPAFKVLFGLLRQCPDAREAGIIGSTISSGWYMYHSRTVSPTSTQIHYMHKEGEAPSWATIGLDSLRWGNGSDAEVIGIDVSVMKSGEIRFSTSLDGGVPGFCCVIEVVETTPETQHQITDDPYPTFQLSKDDAIEYLRKQVIKHRL